MSRSAILSPPAPRRFPPAATGAFTLVEVLLAIGLAAGLLLVALTFYRQATDMRSQILQESDRVAALRLVLDRLASDLRAAQPNAKAGDEFKGDATSMSFVKEALVSPPPDAPLGPEPTDLVRISLSTLFRTNTDRVVVNGLERIEAPLYTTITAPEQVDTNSIPLFPEDEEDWLDLTKEPFGEALRFVRFRYWDGASWQAGWTNVNPPAGVEIILSLTAARDGAATDVMDPEGSAAEGLPLDACRRVVFVPGGAAHPAPESGSNIVARITVP